MVNIKHIIRATCTLSLLSICACSTDNGGDNPTPSPAPEQKLPIHINTLMSSRATDNAFEEGDAIGLFVVNRNSNNSQTNLQASGNYIDNCKFTYQGGAWTTTSPIYWKDNNTHADFYMYYPYTTSLSSVTAMPWTVKTDQSTPSDYKAGDLLIGKTTDIAPTESAVSINAKHVMSQMTTTLVAGNGFTESSLASSNVSVKINHLKTQATIQLATSTVTATGATSDIVPMKENGHYKALVIPQPAPEGNIITITVDGREYHLPKATNFQAFETGKNHQFTVTLSKTSNGVNVNITKWEDDGIDHGGTAE